MIEQYQQTIWTLQDLLADPVEESLNSDLARLEEAVTSFEGVRERLSDDIAQEEFLGFFERIKFIAGMSQRLGGYSNLFFSQDTQNPAALNLRSRIGQVITNASNRILFFDIWFKGLPDDAAARLMQDSGDLYYYLDSLRRFIPHTLSEAEEKVINLKDVNGIDALIGVYDMITNRFTFNLEVDGEKKTLTRDGLASYFRHPSPEVRAATYQELNRVYNENSTVLAQIYNHRVRDWHAEALELRHFSSPISVRNLANDIPDAAIDTLLSVCRKNNAIFQRYFRLKAGWLGMDRLRRYDIYAPLAQSEKQFPFDQGVNLVMESFTSFAPEVAESARQVFAVNHLDSELRPGKRSGAFCYSVLPELIPWVMVNYAGKARDVATLAHELGHAVHSLVARDHSILTFRSTLPLAETASVFAEMLLTNRLLASEDDRNVRRDLLANAIDDAYATIQRQAYFSLFERDAHQMILEGQTMEQVCARYMENLVEQFGDAVEITDEFKWEWTAIPHIFRAPFYTYAYSFGQLLVLALYQQYRVQGSSFVPHYLKILSYGGSKSPVAILNEAGIDISAPSFWQGGFDFLEGMIRDLEAL